MAKRKWRENIKYEGKPIGRWLNEQNWDPSSQRAASNTPEPVHLTTNLQGANVEDKNIAPCGAEVLHLT